MNGALVPKPGAPTGIEAVVANPELIAVAVAVTVVVAWVAQLAAGWH